MTRVNYVRLADNATDLYSKLGDFLLEFGFYLDNDTSGRLEGLRDALTETIDTAVDMVSLKRG